MVDRGVRYRLEPARPASVEVEGEIRFGRSSDVPSRLAEEPTGLATIVLIASPDGGPNERALAAIEASLPSGADVVVVADDVDAPLGAAGHEVIRTSAGLGHGAALNIGIRRARAAVVVVVRPSIVPTGDVVTPLVEALRDPTVAVVGSLGYATTDLRRFADVEPVAKAVDVAAIEGGLMAFHRVDGAERGPVDEAFRAERYLDVWWSLVLRDAGEGGAQRRAVALPGLPVERVDSPPPRASATVDARRAKRNFYRVLDRFRTRLDLAVPPPEA